MSQGLGNRSGAALGERPPDRRVIVSRAQRLMATEVSVQLAVEPWRIAEADTALADCFAWFSEVEWRLTRFQPESELCALNRAAGEWFAASETLFSAVYVATRAAFASDGLFNPALLRQIEALGYDRDFSLLSQRADAAAASTPCPTPERARESMPAPLDAWKGIIFNSARQRIRLPQGVALDLGGIAKGWAADVAMERYCARFPGALINVGGDLRLHGGPQPGQPWTIGIRDPRDSGESQTAHGVEPDSAAPDSAEVWNRASLAVSRGALASSGAVRRWWRKDGARYHHLLDPHTGQPLPLWTTADDVDADPLELATREPLTATVTALAPTGAQAEVATKMALARGRERAMAEVERAWARWGAVGPKGELDASVALIFTLSDGRVIHSANLADWLASWGTDDAPLPLLLNTPGAEPLVLGSSDL